MANQYDKVKLFIEDKRIIDESSLSKNLSITTIDVLKDILPKDIETIDLLITKIKNQD